MIMCPVREKVFGLNGTEQVMLPLPVPVVRSQSRQPGHIHRRAPRTGRPIGRKRNTQRAQTTGGTLVVLPPGKLNPQVSCVTVLVMPAATTWPVRTEAAGIIGNTIKGDSTAASAAGRI